MCACGGAVLPFFVNGLMRRCKMRTRHLEPVEMNANVIPITRNLETAWAEYLDCRARAERTGLIEDGIAAGKSWRRWIDLFLTDDQRKAIGGNR